MKFDIASALKSKTIRGILVVLIAVAMQSFVISPQEVTQTIDDLGPSWEQVSQEQSNPLESLTHFLEFAGLAYAAYGRVVAKKPLIKTKETENEK